MIFAFELAGIFAAHAIWCVSEGDLLIPMLSYTDAQGRQHMDRLIHEDATAAVNLGKSRLETNDMNAEDAALIYDGRIQLNDGKSDSIIVELRTYFSLGSKAAIAIPYTPKVSGTFKVHKPKLLQWDGCEDFDIEATYEHFFRGVFSHEQGAKVWKDAMDEGK